MLLYSYSSIISIHSVHLLQGNHNLIFIENSFNLHHMYIPLILISISYTLVQLYN